MFILVLLWFYCGFIVVLLWFYCGFIVVLLWFYYIMNNPNVYGGYVLTTIPFYVRLYVKSFCPRPFRFTQNGGFILERI